MKRLGELIFLTSLCTIFLLSIFYSRTFAYDMDSANQLSFTQNYKYLNWTVLPMKEDVSSNKAWSIVFTQPIDKSSLNGTSIYVTDGNSNVIDIDLQQSDDGKPVKALPLTNYLPGHPYYLYITNNLKSSSGCPCEPTCMTFTIETDSTKVNELYNNQSIDLKKGDILELTLEEHADGGYCWTFTPPLDHNILEVIDETYISPNPDPERCGSLIQKRWLIQAIGTGSTSIDLKESGPSETDSIHTFNLKTIVK